MARSKQKEQKKIYVFDLVQEILNMFQVLRQCYESLPDKSGIKLEFVLFDGFDGHSEGDYFEAAQSIACGDPAIRAYDSHMPRLNSYQTLMQRWRDSKDMQNLTHADLVRITAPLNSD